MVVYGVARNAGSGDPVGKRRATGTARTREERSIIAGSTVRVAQPGATLGVRPEAISLDGTVDATITSLEYLGSDLVLRCAVGSEQITVRADGKCELREGEQVRLQWPGHEEHYFDAAGARRA